jgi:MYXO-CTERM domain-containing protein
MGCGCNTGSSSNAFFVMALVGLALTKRRRAVSGAVLALAVLVPSLARAEEPDRVAVMAIKPLNGVKADLASVVTNQLTSGIAARGYVVMSPDEIQTILGVARQKQLMGCAESACFMEVGSALGSKFIVTGSLAKVGSSTVIDLSVVNTLTNAVEKRFSQRIKNATEDALLDLLPKAIATLLPVVVKKSPVVEAKPPEPVVVTPIDTPVVVTEAEPPPATSQSTSRRFGIDVRGQAVAPFLVSKLHGNFGVLATFRVLSWLELGAAALISLTPGGAVHAGLVLGSESWVVHPLVVLEVPILATGTPTVGVTGSVGVEWNPLPLLAVRAEIPASYYFVSAQRNFFLLGSLSMGVRL